MGNKREPYSSPAFTRTLGQALVSFQDAQVQSFVLGVASSIVAAAVIAAIVSIWNRRTRDSREFTVARKASYRLLRTGLSNFYENRDDYARYRKQASLLEYMSQASESLHVASYWMAHGIEMENVAERLAELVVKKPGLTVTIAVIDYKAPYIDRLADYLNIDRETLAARAQWSLNRLSLARDNLTGEAANRFTVRIYTSVPTASFILIDAHTKEGRVQMDFKPYKTPRASSITFEFRNRGRKGSLYDILTRSTLQLLSESPDYTEPETQSQQSTKV